jgi:hypothetical protein
VAEVFVLLRFQGFRVSRFQREEDALLFFPETLKLCNLETLFYSGFKVGRRPVVFRLETLKLCTLET